YDRVIQLQPVNGDAWANRCGARALSGDLQGAVSDCGESIKLKANNGTAFDNRGLAYLKMGQFELAVADFDAALRVNPRLSAALYGRGMAKLGRGDASGSTDIENAKQIRPNITEVFARTGLSPEVQAKNPEPPKEVAPPAPQVKEPPKDTAQQPK